MIFCVPIQGMGCSTRFSLWMRSQDQCTSDAYYLLLLQIKQIVNNAAVDNNWVVGFLNHVNSTGLDLRDIQQYLSQQVCQKLMTHQCC